MERQNRDWEIWEIEALRCAADGGYQQTVAWTMAARAVEKAAAQVAFLRRSGLLMPNRTPRESISGRIRSSSASMEQRLFSLFAD